MAGVQQNPGSAGSGLLRAQSQGAPKTTVAHQPPPRPKEHERSSSGHRGAAPSLPEPLLSAEGLSPQGEFPAQASPRPCTSTREQPQPRPQAAEQTHPSSSTTALPRITQTPLPREAHKRKIT